MVSKKNRTSRNSFKARLCASKNDDIDVDDERDAYFNNESNYLLCGIICTKSMVIIFNFLFIVSYSVWAVYFYASCLPNLMLIKALRNFVDTVRCLDVDI